MTGQQHLAQLNIARMRAPKGDPAMEGFFSAVDRINGLAEASDGFVWRLVDDEAARLREGVFLDRGLLVTLSVWRDIEALRDFTYRTEHLDFLRRRAEWFGRLESPHMVLWWVPAGHRPSLAEGRERLDRLRKDGPTPEAFPFSKVFVP